MKKLIIGAALSLSIAGAGLFAINLNDQSGIPTQHQISEKLDYAGIPTQHSIGKEIELAGIPTQHSIGNGFTVMGIPTQH
ncbi:MULTISPECIES: hypothetical protein [Bacillaceae]|uniref:Uncharacterized protein n=1 Tax=Cytobacillus firmus DS1 TaxID=1307436 RepID=W7KMG3_CYTFI|nr:MULTISPECIES: hypothetical protein [Bacillaceae]EWG08595.1 hypothetical protein PBF_23418 [Cytobacillus firmus DS1]MBN8203918.1 hypothetical protein [Bacillus sp. NTK034]